jgi:peptide/nickel transport system substrate-binding protein
VNNTVVFRPDNPLVADIRCAQGAAARDQRAGDRRDAVLANYPQATSIIASTAQGYVDLSAKLGYDPALAAGCSTRRAGRWDRRACARRTARNWC